MVLHLAGVRPHLGCGRRVLGFADQPPEGGGGRAARQERRWAVSGKRTRTLSLIAGMVVVLGGFGYLLYGNIGENIVFFRTPSELLDKGAEAYDKPVRLGGQVKAGS